MRQGLPVWHWERRWPQHKNYFLRTSFCVAYTANRLSVFPESLFASGNLGEYSGRYKICCFLECPFINRMVRRDFTVLIRFFIHK